MYSIKGIISNVLVKYPIKLVKNKYKKAININRTFFKIKVKSIFSNFSLLFLLEKLLIINRIDRQIIPIFKKVGAVFGPTTPSPVVRSENSVDLISNNKNKLIMSKANPEEKLKFLNLFKLNILKKRPFVNGLFQSTY